MKTLASQTTGAGFAGLTWVAVVIGALVFCVTWARLLWARGVLWIFGQNLPVGVMMFLQHGAAGSRIWRCFIRTWGAAVIGVVCVAITWRTAMAAAGCVARMMCSHLIRLELLDDFFCREECALRARGAAGFSLGVGAVCVRLVGKNQRSGKFVLAGRPFGYAQGIRQNQHARPRRRKGQGRPDVGRAARSLESARAIPGSTYRPVPAMKTA